MSLAMTKEEREAFLAETANHRRLPTMYVASPSPRSGGLMSYGANSEDLYRRSAEYMDKILRGPSPLIVRWNGLPSSSSRSTSRPPRPSDSRSRHRLGQSYVIHSPASMLRR